MTQIDHPCPTPANPTYSNPTYDCIRVSICGFLVPFFLAGAGGNLEVARAAVLELIDCYNPGSPAELDLVGRIVGFSFAALDNLAVAAGGNLSDTKLLRYRSNAVSLSRASDQARQMLQMVQQGQENTRKIPRPTVAAAPNRPAPAPRPDPLQLKAPAVPTGIAHTVASNLPSIEIEAMKGDARAMLAAFSKLGAQASTAIGMIPDPASLAKSAALINPQRRT